MPPTIICLVLEHGKVRLAFADGKKILQAIDMPASDVALIAAHLLDAAKQSCRIAGLQPSNLGESLEGTPTFVPSRIGITGGPNQDQLSLVLHMGTARLAVAMSIASALDIGQALVAASAPTHRPN